jgi:putative addiction module antidote
MDLKLRKVGSAIGLTLPTEVRRALGVRAGDTIVLEADAERGGFRLTAQDREVAAQLALARSAARRYHRTIRELSR